MFEWIDSNEATRKWKQTGEQSIEHRFHYYNDAPLNDTHHTCRARWRIENETFNTLKNQGYHFEHNFGHGNQNLVTVLMHIMILAFLIDQIQQRCCRLFQRALEKMGSKTRFWAALRERFTCYLIMDWESLYGSLAYKLKPSMITIDTS